MLKINGDNKIAIEFHKVLDKKEVLKAQTKRGRMI